MTTPPSPVVLFTNSQAMGGMEQHVTFLASGFVERGIRAAAVCSPTLSIAALRHDLARLGVEVHTPPDRPGTGGAVGRVRDLVAAFEPYAGGILHVHSTGFHGGELVMLAGRRAGITTIVRTEHVPPQSPLRLRDRLSVQWRDRLLVSKVICVSEENRRDHIEILGRDPGRIEVVPNGIDVERFVDRDGTAVRASLGIDEQTLLVGVIGRLAEARKGISEFLQMVASLDEEQHRALFVVVGDGPLRPELERLSADLGLQQRVRFLGERTDIADILAALDVFVMPSIWEAGPLTLLEAMTAGRAVVTTRVGVVPQTVVHGHNGLVVTPGDVQQLSEAVGQLLEDRELARRLGAAAAAEAQRSFSVELMVERTLSVYEAARR